MANKDSFASFDELISQLLELEVAITKEKNRNQKEGEQRSQQGDENLQELKKRVRSTIDIAEKLKNIHGRRPGPSLGVRPYSK